MKKLINSPDAVLQDALHGVEAAHGDRVRVIYEPAVIVRIDAPVKGKVGLVSGGGSGHEPMHGGYVGPGMLDAACPGEVFTSPTPDQMLEATKAVDGGAGVVHIVKNYTGDVMNFDMAADMGKGDDIEVETVLTNDDVAVEDSLYTAGRRGVGVTVLSPSSAGGLTPTGARWAWRSPRASPRPPATRASSSPTTRSRSGSASMASPGASGRRSDRRRRLPSG
jgi:dihydroxyacetone kinase-like protein